MTRRVFAPSGCIGVPAGEPAARSRGEGREEVKWRRFRCVFAPFGRIVVPAGVPASAFRWDNLGVSSPAHSVAFDAVGYLEIWLMAPS